MLDRPNDAGVLTGLRDEQPKPNLNVTMRLQTTCADNRNGTSIVFVTATREENQLQKMKQTTSVGVGPATLTMPSGSARVLGTVRRETIKDPAGPATDQGNDQHDRADTRADRKDIAQDRADLRADERNLRQDYQQQRDGVNERDAITQEHADIHADRRDIAQDRADMSADQRNVDHNDNGTRLDTRDDDARRIRRTSAYG
jgi:hypothetical protein